MKIESFFYAHPIFRFEEFVYWKNKQGTFNPSAIRKSLLHHVQAGHLLHIRRGIYAVVPPNESTGTSLVDPYLLAAKITSDSVLAYHTALELHGLAYSVFRKYTFLTAQKSRDLEFQNYFYQAVTIPTALKKNNAIEFGIEKINRQGIIISITNMARTFVDVLDRIELSGGWEEVVRSISNIAILNIDEVITYCLLLNNRTLAAKLGFFLEQRTGAFSIALEHLNTLLKLKPVSPQYLADPKQQRCQLVKKWNLVVPLQVLNQSWEEPIDDN